MNEQSIKHGNAAELLVITKLEDFPTGYSVLFNVDIAGVGRTSELDTIVVTPTGVIVILEVKAGDLAADEAGHVVRS